MNTFPLAWLAEHTQYKAVGVIDLLSMHSVVYDMHMCKSGYSCWGITSLNLFSLQRAASLSLLKQQSNLRGNTVSIHQPIIYCMCNWPQ